MMELYEHLMRFFRDYTTLGIVIVIFICSLSWVLSSLARFDALHTSFLRYAGGVLSLVFVAAILLMATPFWTTLRYGNSSFMVFITALVILVLALWNLITAIQFFTKKKIYQKIG
jgi:hypothetical protein